jgi:hypothetical protein
MRAEIVTRTESLGHLYEVNVKAPKESLLDLDKPLSEQSPQVRAALESSDQVGIGPETLGWRGAPAAVRERMLSSTTGHKLYDQLLDVFKGNKEAISEHLQSLGIRGLKYLDEGSRAKGATSQTSNYVIFNPRDAIALRRNGEDLAAAARRQGSPENSLTADAQAAGAADAQLREAIDADDDNALRAQVNRAVADLKTKAAYAGVDVEAQLKELDQMSAEAEAYGKAARAAVLCGVNH